MMLTEQQAWWRSESERLCAESALLCEESRRLRALSRSLRQPPVPPWRRVVVAAYRAELDAHYGEPGGQ